MQNENSAQLEGRIKKYVREMERKHKDQMEWKGEWKSKSWKKIGRNCSNRITIDQRTNPITIPNEKLIKCLV